MALHQVSRCATVNEYRHRGIGGCEAPLDILRHPQASAVESECSVVRISARWSVNALNGDTECTTLRLTLLDTFGTGANDGFVYVFPRSRFGFLDFGFSLLLFCVTSACLPLPWPLLPFNGTNGLEMPGFVTFEAANIDEIVGRFR